MDKISSKHFILFIFGVTYISLKTYPSLFISEGGRDIWLYTLVIYLIFILFAMYLIYVMSSRKVYNINEIFTGGLSKFLGNICLFLFAIGLFLASVEAASVEANVINSNYFLETPTWYILLFFLLPSMFLIGKSITTFTIFTIITLASLGFNTFALAAITEKYKDMKYVMPVLSGNIGSSFLSTALLVLGSLSAFVIALPYLKFIDKDTHLKKHSLISLLILGAICIYTLFGLISTFGPERAANLFYPEFSQTQRVQIGGFLEFGEFFFLYQTVVGLFLKYVICVYGVYILLEKYIKKNTYFIAIYTVIIFVLATFLSRNNYILFFLLKYYQYINLVIFIVIPLIAFSSFLLRYKKK